MVVRWAFSVQARVEEDLHGSSGERIGEVCRMNGLSPAEGKNDGGVSGPNGAPDEADRSPPVGFA